MENQSSKITHLEVYKRALAIFNVSRQLSTYITDNKNITAMQMSTNIDDRYSLQMVMDSMSLAPDIAEASVTLDFKLKRYKMKRLKRTLIRIHRYCDYLEKRYEHAKDYISILRKEISDYRKAQTNWENSLLNKN